MNSSILSVGLVQQANTGDRNANLEKSATAARRSAPAELSAELSTIEAQLLRMSSYGSSGGVRNGIRKGIRKGVRRCFRKGVRKGVRKDVLYYI